MKASSAILRGMDSRLSKSLTTLARMSMIALLPDKGKFEDFEDSLSAEDFGPGPGSVGG